MFTGIISHIGKLTQVKNNHYTFWADKSICEKLTTGASIAVNGTCLTVVESPKDNTFSVTIMPETVQKTNIGVLQNNDLVNLELPATVQTFLSGHIVQGHVDGIGKIIDIKSDGNSKILKIGISPELNKYIVEKGSITVNGISLTVIKVENSSFTVGLIPHTWENTMLHKLKAGDKVNIETDILAKYVEKLLIRG